MTGEVSIRDDIIPNGNILGNPIKPDGTLDPPPPSIGFFEAFPFVREDFDRERQLWLAQNIQNYAYSLVHFPPNFPYGRTLIIQNGEAGYFRTIALGWEIALPDDRDSLPITITSLYSQIDELVNKGSRFAIEYKSDFHYPWYVHCRYSVKNGYSTYTYSLVNDFIIDPEIPAEVAERDEYGGITGKLIPNPLL